MLATFFVMLMISSLYLIHHQHPESVTNISNLSPTHLVCNIRHQYRFNRLCMVKQVCTGLKADLGIETNINIQHGQIGSHNSLNVEMSHYSDFKIKMLL